jgi:hypothetical protein
MHFDSFLLFIKDVNYACKHIVAVTFESGRFEIHRDTSA